MCIPLHVSCVPRPVLLDIDNPAFLAGFRRIQRLAMGIDESRRRGGAWAAIRGAWMRMRIFATLVHLYFLPTIRNTLPTQARLSPVW